MPSKIQMLLQDRNEQIDYKKIVQSFPWVIQEKQNCILSPDSDGLLCGLLMSNYLGWKIRGFYDGKVLLLEDGFAAQDCVFLDMEVFRKNIRSIGHHMVLYNKRALPTNWDNYTNCIQPNIFRGYDGKNDFRLKYPLATIHLLIPIVNLARKVEIPETAVCPLFFTDGTFNVLFKYPENVLNWLNFLRANEPDNPLKKVFENDNYSVFTLMKAMDDFFRERDKISITNERGDRLRISETDGSPVNTEKTGNLYSINQDAKNRIEKFLELLAELTGWSYNKSHWTWTKLKIIRFKKRDFKADNLSVCNRNFDGLMQKNPITWAMTSNQNIEYTVEEMDTL